MMHMKKRLFAIILTLCLLAGLAGCSNGKNDPTAGTAGTTVAPYETAAILFPQTGNLEEVAVSTEHFSLNKGEMVYLYAISVSNFLNDYYNYLSYLGLDPSVSFKNQTSLYGDETWFDYFLTDAELYAQDYLIFCEAALANGMELDQADEEYIARQKQVLEEEASSYGWTLGMYLEQVYSTNLEWKYIESCLRITRLAQKAYLKLVGDVTFSDEEVEAEYQRNPKAYSLVDLYAIGFGDGENIPEELLTGIRKELSEVKDLDSFREVVKHFLRETRTTKTIEDAGGLDKYTDKYMSENLKRGQTYNENVSVLKWAFAADTAEGSVVVEENDKTKAPDAYFLLKKPYRDESVTIDVRHILFMIKGASGGTYETAELARSAAEKVYQEWIAGGKTREMFVSLCSQYSADGNASSGGLYTDVPAGKMVPPFNDWCFDANRRTGDHGIVDTEFGSHIMYFEGRHIAWKYKVETALSDALYEEVYEKQMKATPVDFRDEVLKSINW